MQNPFRNQSQINDGSNYNCVDIGGRAYLWTPPGTSPQALIITAHGGRLTSSEFTVKSGNRLFFYSDDKYSVNDPGLVNFYEGQAVYKQDLSAGQSCYNYSLSKYTNSKRNVGHNKNSESYDSINELMEKDYEQEGQNLLQTLSEAGGKLGPNRKADLEKKAMKSISQQPYSILTVRNRRFRQDIHLSWVLDQLAENGHHFKVIHCLFCRNNFWTLLPYLGNGYAQDVTLAN